MPLVLLDSLLLVFVAGVVPAPVTGIAASVLVMVPLAFVWRPTLATDIWGRSFLPP